MALLLLYSGLSWSRASYGIDLKSACEEYFQSPLAKEDRARVIQPHFGKFSHHAPLQSYALDLVASPGASVRAMKDGVVFRVVSGFGTGKPEPKYLERANFVAIKHDHGLYTLYSHLERNSVPVKEGQKVHTGDVIGALGCSGYCEGPHLHIEGFIRGKNGRLSVPIKIVDPQGRGRMIYAQNEEVWSFCP